MAQDELCEAVTEYINGTPASSSALFRAVDELGSVASRYKDNADVADNGAQLVEMADSSSIDLRQAADLVSVMRTECDLPPIGSAN